MEGFRIARRSPGTLLVWGLYYLLCVAVFIGVLFAFAAPTMMQLFTNPTAAANPGDPMAAMKLIGSLGLGYFVGLIVMIFMLAVLIGGVFRSVLTPEDKGFAYLKFGGRELKLGVSMLLIGLVMIVLYLILFMLGLFAAGGMNAGGAPNFNPLLVFLIYIPLLLVWTGFSLSYPAAFATNSIRVFEGWKLAGGNFWKLVGMYLLVILFFIGLIIALMVVMMVFGMIFGAGMMAIGSGSNAGMGALGPMAIIGMIIGCILYLVFLAFTVALFYGSVAAAYKQIVGVGDEAKVF